MISRNYKLSDNNFTEFFSDFIFAIGKKERIKEIADFEEIDTNLFLYAEKSNLELFKQLKYKKKIVLGNCFTFEEREHINIENKVEFANRLTGNYAILAYANKNLEIITDIGSSIPIYRYITNDLILLSTRMDWIMKRANRSFTADPIQVFSLVTPLDSTIENKTIIKEIDILQENSIHIFGTDLSYNQQFYRTIDFKQEIEDDRALDVFVEYAFKSFDRIQKNNGNLILSLTGGYDSRLNFANALTYSHKTFETYTWAGSHLHPDVFCAKRIAKDYNIKHHIYKQKTFKNICNQNYIDELVMSTGGLARHSFLFMKTARQKVFSRGYSELAGMGPETIKGDKYYQGEISFIDKLNKNIQNSFKKVNEEFNFQIGLDFETEILDLFNNRLFRQMPNNLNSAEMADFYSYRNRLLSKWRNRYKMSLEGTNLYFPLFDTEMIIDAFKLSYKIKENNYIHKYILKQLRPELLEYPKKPSFSLKARRKIQQSFEIDTKPSDWGQIKKQFVKSFTETLKYFQHKNEWFTKTDIDVFADYSSQFKNGQYFRLYSALRFIELLRAKGVKINIY